MANPLRDVFGPRAVVGLEITEHYICAVQVSNPQGHPEVEHLVFRKINRPEEQVEALRAIFEEEKLDRDSVISAIPSSLTMTREISLPFDKQNKVRKIIKYQMERYVPYPIEEMVVDFLPTAAGDPVFTLGAHKKAMSDHLDLLAAADVVPRVVSVRSVALSNLLVQSGKCESEKPVFLIHLDEEQTCIQAIFKSRLDFIRTLPGTGGWLDRVKETFALYQLKRPGTTVSEILITGPSADKEGIVVEISALMNVKATLWQPFDQFRCSQDNVERDVQARLSVALGLALSMTSGFYSAFNLRKEEFALESIADTKPLIIFMVSTLFLLVALFTFNLYQKLDHQEAYFAALDRSIRQAFTETFPNTKLVKGRELEIFRNKFETEKERYRWLDDFSSGGSVLDVILIMTKVISRHTDVKIENLSIDDKEIHLDGSASSFKIVDSLKGKFSKTGCFENVKLVGARADKKQNLVEFNFVLVKKHEN